MKTPVTVLWFRRDLRLKDNAAAYNALSHPLPVLPIFIFDRLILSKLQNQHDLRVQFIYQQLLELRKALQKVGSDLLVLYGEPLEVWKQLVAEWNIDQVFVNNDYEPYAITRDKAVSEYLSEMGIGFAGTKDQVVFEKQEVVKPDGKPYTVFTPYSRKWLIQLASNPVRTWPTEPLFHNFRKVEKQFDWPSLEQFGFLQQPASFPQARLTVPLLEAYETQRNFPAIEGTSRLGIHLRFGTISIRALLNHAFGISTVFVNELIWRDFYQMILFNFPQVGRGKAFKPAYDEIRWRNNELEFEAWRAGQTGYPLVDAGMRQLAATGYMHNRVRMVTASFLCKHLLIDWRWGEAWFAEKLLDFDLAANNGGWQWAAGSGCDAAPYFRIFNPALQQKKFDRQMEYCRYWVPELGTKDYARPIVDHEQARVRALQTYKAALDREYR